MNILFYILLLLLLLIVICYPFIGYSNLNNNRNNRNNRNNINNINNIKNKEKFLTENIDPDKDGRMTFSYLTNPNYKNSILSNYYFNNDTVINGVRVMSHPYQISYSPNGRDKYYGTLFYDKKKSDNIYYTTKIRL
jgi:hypothetical protein